MQWNRRTLDEVAILDYQVMRWGEQTLQAQATQAREIQDMFKHWGKQAASPIGVDFGSRFIKVAQVQRRAGRPSVLTRIIEVPAAQREQAQPDCEALSDLLTQALRSGRFVGRDVVSCLASSDLWLRHMRLAPMPSHELRAAAHWQASQQLKLDPATFQSDLLDVGEITEAGKRRRELIVVAAPTEALERHVRVLTEAGLRPLAIDVAASAMARCLAHPPLGNEQAAAQLILSIGHAASTVVIARAGVPCFVRNISVGTGNVDRHMASKLEMQSADTERLCDAQRGVASSSADPIALDAPVAAVLHEARQQLGQELAQAVSMSLQHYAGTFRQARPTVGVLVGGGAGEPTLAACLSERSGLAFEPLGADTSDDAAADDGAASAIVPQRLWAVACGLSLYNVGCRATAAPTGAAA